MADELAKGLIRLEVDASGVEAGVGRAKGALDDLAGTAERTGVRVGKGVDEAGDGSAAAAAKMEASTRTMIRAIQRVSAEMEAGGRNTRRYYELMAEQRGVNASALAPYLDQLEALTVRQKSAGLSAGQMEAAMRNLPAQFTDIATGLATGQQPLTVFLQQGGQLKDMFGGMGAAGKALGEYMLALATPVTLAAAAVVGLGYAYNSGSREADAYAKALINTNGAAGATADQMAAMASSINGVTGTTAKAAEVLAAFAASGAVAAKNFEKFGQIAIQAEEVLGSSIDSIAKDFASLGDEPLKAAQKLDESMRFLTVSIYEQIKALEEQGNASAAADVAQNAYADTLARRTAEMQQNLGYIESGWHAITRAAKGAADAILEFGRKNTIAQELAQQRTELARLSAGGTGVGSRFGMPLPGAEKKRQELEAAIAINEEALRREMAAGSRKAEMEAVRKAGIAAMVSLDALSDQMSTRGERYAKALKKLRDDVAAANRASRLEGKGDVYSAIQVGDMEKRLAEQYADKSKKKSGSKAVSHLNQKAVSHLNQYESMRDQLKQQLIALADDDDKTSKAWEERLNDAKYQYLTVAQRKELTDLAKAVDLQREAKERADALKKYRDQADQVVADLGSQRAATRLGYERQMESVGRGQQAQAEVERINAIVDRAEEVKRGLNDKVALKFITEEEKIAQVTRIDAVTAAMVQDAEKFAAAMKQANGDWTNGASRAFENYRDNASNIASQVESMMTSALGNLEDAFVRLAQTGKLSFRDMTTAILADIARIQARKAIAGLISAAGSWVESSFGPSVIGSAKGNAFSGGGVARFAKGGAFTNSIAAQPTLAPMALFGEAGPEAVMPLTRDSQGRLGVRAPGAGGQTQYNFSFVFEGESDGGLDPAVLARAIKTTVRDVLAQERRPGGMMRA